MRQDLISSAYELLNWHEPQRALAVFKLNVDAYQNSWNAYDSLGERNMNVGNTTQVIASYQRSLELNPNNTNAREMLKKLRAR